MADGIVTLTSGTFDETVNSSSTPVVVDFWAEWCGPCRTISPIIDEIGKSYEGSGVKVFKANVDECSELSTKFGIRSIPTIVVLKNGIEEGRINGASGSLAQKIEELVNKAKS